MVEAGRTGVSAAISRFPLFKGLDSDKINCLSKGAYIVSANRGEILDSNRSDAIGFYGILDGKLKLMLLSRFGHEHVFDILQPGMTFGELSFQQGAPCPLYAEALVRSELLCLNRDQLLTAMENCPELGLNMVNSLTINLHRLLTNLETCCLKSAAQRVAHFLLSHTQDGDGPGGGRCVDLPTSKRVVASTLDLTPETFSRILHQFEKDGLLQVCRRHIEIFDPDGLEEYEDLDTRDH